MGWRAWMPVTWTNKDGQYAERVSVRLAWSWEWRLWPVLIWWGYGFNLSLGPAMVIANWSSLDVERAKRGPVVP